MMEIQPTEHVGEERLESYALNSLAADESAVIEEHLLYCETCLDRLEAVERYVRAMKNAGARITKEEGEAPAKTGAWDRLRGLIRVPVPVWGGCIVMAAIIVAIGLQVGRQPGPPVKIELQALRGPDNATAPAGHALDLRLDTRGVEQPEKCRIQIVDSEGRQVWSGYGAWSDDVMTASVQKFFRPGTYFVRLFRDNSDEPDPLREYQLLLE